MALVRVTGTYVSGMTPKTGTVTFYAVPGGEPTPVTLDANGSVDLILRATDVSPKLVDYYVVENLSSGVHTYTLALPSTLLRYDLVTGAPTYGSAGVPGSVVVGVGAGLYVVPAAATMVLFECFGGCGGGGGGAVTPVNSDAWGGGGGAGGGRTVKWVEAAALRAAHPSGVPYTVGGGGAGGAPGVAGGAGGYTFAGDFVVATPGQGGFPGGIGSVGLPLTPGLALGGANGTGDSYGGAGGTGGGLNTDMGDRGLILYDGTWNGSIGGFQVIGNSGNVTVEVVQLGGGGGGGGGGGISPSPLPGGVFPTVVANTPGNGGNSGFASTADPTPLAGSGGIVGGALPTSAGASVIPGMSAQGGGGGGAASLTGNAQSGASALPGSFGGGGGGGSCRTGHTAGSGGNGDAGFMRIMAI